MQAQCTVDECERGGRRRKGLCDTHYSRLLRKGDPSIGNDARFVPFWDRVDTGGDCWLWMGQRDENGYGRVHYTDSRPRTHRLAWELTFGVIPGHLQVLHHCDNPPCCRPDHLFLGTQGDNIADMVMKDRHWKGGRRKKAA